MRHRPTDEAEYWFLTAPAAAVQVKLGTHVDGGPEIQVFGNRAGLLSLANVLLWLEVNAWREFLSLRELPFVGAEGALSVCMRVTDDEATGRDGLLTRTDNGEQFEWVIAGDDLRRVALVVHRLACNPSHEYDLMDVAEGSAAGVHVRMTDAVEWLR
jgi:hypothetical protein